MCAIRAWGVRAHAKAIWDRLETFLFLMNAVAAAPPPSLMHKGTVRRVHQAYDAMIHAAGQVSGEVCDLVFLAERWDSRWRKWRLGEIGRASGRERGGMRWR